MNGEKANKILSVIQKDIEECEKSMLTMRENAIPNIKKMFKDPLERSIAVLLHNAFTYYTWRETVSSFEKTLDEFIGSIQGKSIVFVFHAENSSSSSQNNCHQKSTFFFTLLALRLRPDLTRKTLGFICNDMYTVSPKTLRGRNDVVYCICEDSIYSGDQITKVVRDLETRNKMDLSKLHVVCPFVREEFVQQSMSKRYHLHAGTWVPSLMTRLSDESVISDTCEQLEKLRLIEGDSSFPDIGICRNIENAGMLIPIFPQRMKHTPVYFSHKTADATSIPLPWLVGILGLGSFDTKESEAFIVNEHVKKSKGHVWSCMRGPYKSHSDALKEVFDGVFVNSKKLKTSFLSRFVGK